MVTKCIDNFPFFQVLPPEPKREKLEGKPYTRKPKKYSKANNKTNSCTKLPEEKTQSQTDSAER